MTGSQLILTWMLAVLAAGGIIIFYFTIIKPKQDEKKESKGTGAQDIVSFEPDQYEGIIDEYPTYHRQK